MNSIWSEKQPQILSKEKKLPTHAEVVIIGGGIAGLLCAFLLKEAGIEAIVLEADHVCSGQTKNTTAKITSQHELIYDKLTGIFGEETAEHYGQINQKAIDEYERIINERKIMCGFERLPAYLYTKTGEGAAKLEKERTAAKKAGIPATIVYETGLPFQVKAALKYEQQAQFHPLEFLNDIVKELNVYENTKVIRVKGHNVTTERGDVTAETVIFATHFPFVNFPGMYFARMHQERSYVLALRPNAGEHAKKENKAVDLNGIYYGIDADGLSFRNAGEYVLIGGSGHRTGVIPAEDPYEKLRKEAKRLWNDYEEVACWAAQDCMTLDSLPYVGHFSRRTLGWYVMTGFRKWGMTGSMAAAMAIRDMLTGQNMQEWEILSPQRKFTLEAGKNLLKELGNTTVIFVTWKRPRCPHLGCRLVWNPYERTWDCPCHGSRLREDGTVVDNPAQEAKKIGPKDR